MDFRPLLLLFYPITLEIGFKTPAGSAALSFGGWASWIVGSRGTLRSVWTSLSDQNWLSTKMQYQFFLLGKYSELNWGTQDVGNVTKLRANSEAILAHPLASIWFCCCKITYLTVVPREAEVCGCGNFLTLCSGSSTEGDLSGSSFGMHCSKKGPFFGE